MILGRAPRLEHNDALLSLLDLDQGGGFVKKLVFGVFHSDFDDEDTRTRERVPVENF